jgi:murein DD-endopeptidase MepM/ murein hydrolase activator NlpD
MAVNPITSESLTIDYKSLMRIPIGNRVGGAATSSEFAQAIMSSLTPSQIAQAFPDYYRRQLPDISNFITSNIQNKLSGRGQSWNQTGGGNQGYTAHEYDGPATLDPDATPASPGKKPPKITAGQFRAVENTMLAGTVDSTQRKTSVTASASKLASILPGLAKNPDLVNAINEQAARFGITPAAIAMILKVENRNLNPAIMGGTNSRYAGLFQMGPTELQSLGLSSSEYLKMSAAQQTKVWGDWLESVNFSARTNIVEGDTNQNFTMLMANQLGSGRNLKDKDGNFIIASQQATAIGGNAVTFNTLDQYANEVNPENITGYADEEESTEVPNAMDVVQNVAEQTQIEQQETATVAPVQTAAQGLGFAPGEEETYLGGISEIDAIPTSGNTVGSREFGRIYTDPKTGKQYPIRPNNKTPGHAGTDFGAEQGFKTGTPWKAHMGGQVIGGGYSVGREGKGYGYYIDVKFDDGSIHRYAHNDENVEKGRFEKGDTVFKVGASGVRSGWAHAHAEVWLPKTINGKEYTADELYRMSAGMGSKTEKGLLYRSNPRDYWQDYEQQQMALREKYLALQERVADDPSVLDDISQKELQLLSERGSELYPELSQAASLKLSQDGTTAIAQEEPMSVPQSVGVDPESDEEVEVDTTAIEDTSKIDSESSDFPYEDTPNSIRYEYLSDNEFEEYKQLEKKRAEINSEEENAVLDKKLQQLNDKAVSQASASEKYSNKSVKDLQKEFVDTGKQMDALWQYNEESKTHELKDSSYQKKNAELGRKYEELQFMIHKKKLDEENKTAQASVEQPVEQKLLGGNMYGVNEDLTIMDTKTGIPIAQVNNNERLIKQGSALQITSASKLKADELNDMYDMSDRMDEIETGMEEQNEQSQTQARQIPIPRVENKMMDEDKRWQETVANAQYEQGTQPRAFARIKFLPEGFHHTGYSTPSSRTA